jgi:hypothetical protein
MTALLMGGAAASLGAQGTVMIDPGMTREQVVAKLGEPLSVRSYDGHTYLLYKNGCEKTCGMSDLVMLDSGKVVDAVFRAQSRHYSGTSSSPRMISMAEAKRGIGSGAPLAIPAGDTTAKPAKPEKPAKVEAAPAKVESKAPSKAAPAKKTDVAPATKAAPAPAKTTAAPPKKAEPAPAKKPEAPAKNDSTKKPPAKPPAGHEG